MKQYITFDGDDRTQWIKTVSSWQGKSRKDGVDEIYIKIINFKSVENILPVHVVLLACLVQHLYDNGYEKCYLTCDNTGIRKFLINDVSLPAYWGSNKSDYFVSGKETIFNLWHAKDENKEYYSRSAPEYLKRKFFKNKDLSAVQTSIMEIYQNIFDHADAKGNSFSFMKYDELTTQLCVAVCDFGKGIATNIKSFFEEIDNDVDALSKAVKPLVTTESQLHNKGWGLSNIINHLQNGDTLRIVSNGAILIYKDNQTKVYSLDTEFHGTLIFYEVSLNNFEDEEKIDNFDLDFGL